MLDQDLTFIRQCLDRKIDEKNPTAVSNRLNELSSLLGLSSETVTNALQEYRSAKGQVIRECKGNDLPASIMKEYIDSECVVNEAKWKLAERYNSGIVHMIDAYRSILSYHKSEIKA